MEEENYWLSLSGMVASYVTASTNC